MDRQRQLYNQYYHDCDWQGKTKFLRAHIVTTPIKKKRRAAPTTNIKEKKYNHEYTLSDQYGQVHIICIKFFTTCLQVTKHRAHHAMKTISVNPTAIDRRGKHPSGNKTKPNDETFVNEYFKRFPTFESNRNEAEPELATKRFLAPSVNIAKMYREYKKLCENEKRTILSESVFRALFKEKHLKIKRKSKRETCKMCTDFEQNVAVDAAKREHHRRAIIMKKTFEADVKRAIESDGLVSCLTFELEKILQTPILKSSNKAFFKRPLWTYNLCIYNEIDKQAYMYVWCETVASRGPEEIASCLIYHLKHRLPGDTRNVVLYSNKKYCNLKLILLLKKFLCDQQTEIFSIEQKFFMSGHTYNGCDASFTYIENKRRKIENGVFDVNDWISLIRTSKRILPKFIVTEMAASNFYSCENLLNCSVQRKEAINGDPINWSLIRKIINNADQPLSLIVRMDGDDEKQQKLVDISKNEFSSELFDELQLKQAAKPRITKAKYSDLMDLLKYIPAKYHEFYKKLEYSDTVRDYGLVSDDDSDDADGDGDDDDDA